MVMVVPEVGGIITSLNVKEGQTITAGSVIASFDSRNIASSKEELQAQMDVAVIMRDKQQTLYDQGLGNIIQLEQARGQVTALEKAMNSLQVQGSKFSVKAPFTGIVEKVYVVKGQVAGPTTPIIMLVGEDERKIVAKISETYLKNLGKGAMVSVDFPVLNEVIDSLEVSRVGGFVDPVNRTIDLEVNLPKFNSEKHVPNLMANINVRDNIVENAILIPSKVILKGAGQSSHVMILEESKENSNDSLKRYIVSKRDIQIGDMYEGKTIVTKGLMKGDVVIDRGRADVNVGNIVEISEL
jgi:RND family efflux transporter MFP subunit